MEIVSLKYSSYGDSRLGYMDEKNVQTEQEIKMKMNKVSVLCFLLEVSGRKTELTFRMHITFTDVIH